jgi:hypothetical protein
MTRLVLIVGPHVDDDHLTLLRFIEQLVTTGADPIMDQARKLNVASTTVIAMPIFMLTTC